MTHHGPGPNSPSQPPYQEPGTPEMRPARPSRRVLTHSVTAIVSLIIGVGIGAGDDAGTSASPRPAVTVTKAKPAEPETVTAEPVASPEEKGGPQAVFSGDGQYLVGEDIKPGTYKTAGADGSNCYWARLKNASGEFDAIIANDNTRGQTRVTVKKGDHFETNGCQVWKRVS